MEKLDKVIAGLGCCGTDAAPDRCPDCPYDMQIGLGCAGELIKDAREVIKVLVDDLTGAHDEIHKLAKSLRLARAERDEALEKLSWQELSRTPNDWGEYPPEFPREGM